MKSDLGRGIVVVSLALLAKLSSASFVQRV
jgi:hypothetical protein